MASFFDVFLEVMASEGVLIRTRQIEDAPASDGMLSMVTSTDAPIEWMGMDGAWREILDHSDGAVDSTGLRALLVNHDPNQIAGKVESFSTGNGTGQARCAMLPDARLASGVSVIEAVKSGALRGVSIGYSYRACDTTWDDKSRTLRVNRWTVHEVTLTPIPADTSAGVRSRELPGFLRETNKTTTSKESTMSEPVTPPAPVVDQAKIREEVATIAKQAEGLGLRSSDYVGKSLADARDAMLADVAKRNAGSNPQTPVVPSTTVTSDGADKLFGAIRHSLYQMGHVKPDADELAEDKHLARAKREGSFINFKQALRQVARAQGLPAEDWSDLQVATWGASQFDMRTHGVRDAANKISAGFSTLLANVATKTVLAGLSSYDAATWQIWCTQKTVPNFLAVTNAGLSTGRLTLIPEGEAAPEITQKDGGYNASLGLYGATISLTMQTIINDQLGEFMRSLRQIGVVAMRTIDRQAYSALLNATWTNDTTTSVTLGTATNLDKVRKDLAGKLNPAGEKMGISPRYLLHDPALTNSAQVATGAIYAPGQTTVPTLQNRSIIPIESAWIGDTSLLAGVLTTTYFLTGNPEIYDTILIQLLEGVGLSPIIKPFDAGATPGERWLILLPFSATAATHTDSAGNARVHGIQKATA